MTKRSKIIGVGSYVPNNVVTNNDLSKMLDTSNEWIVQRTGIEQRYWVDANSEVATSDLGYEAAVKAIKNAQIDKNDLDMIIFATMTPDHEFPGSACFLQKKLDLPGIPAIDVRQQCSGFLFALSMAEQYIRNGEYKKVLIVGAEVSSKGLDKSPTGRNVTILFGDGAGAVVVSACDITDSSKDSHVLSTHIHCDGRFAEELWVSAPGSAHIGGRITHELIDQKAHFGYMNGKMVFITATKKIPEAILETLAFNNIKKEDVDLFVLHQANLRINEKITEILGVDPSKVFNTIQKYGNTTAATVPLGLSDAVEAGKIKPGSLVASATFGSGFTWASALIRW